LIESAVDRKGHIATVTVERCAAIGSAGSRLVKIKPRCGAIGLAAEWMIDFQVSIGFGVKQLAGKIVEIDGFTGPFQFKVAVIKIARDPVLAGTKDAQWSLQAGYWLPEAAILRERKVSWK
jgi:hypothetical protein